MSNTVRSIRSIERSSSYIAVSSVQAYSLYPKRGGELQLPSTSFKEWIDTWRQSALSATFWLQLMKEIHASINQIAGQYKVETFTQAQTNEGNEQIAMLINNLYGSFVKHIEELRPELWERIEEALHHPALSKLGFTMGNSEDAYILPPKGDSSPLPLNNEERKEIQRLLTGTDGFLTELKRAIAYSETLPPVQLLRRSWHTSKNYMPYMAYYNAMQTHFPMPMVGMIMNLRY